MDVQRLLEPVYRGKRVLLVSGPVQSKTATVAVLRTLGVADCLVVGSMGTGPPPEAACVVVDAPATDVVDEFRQWERIAATPPAEVARAVERFAPDLVITNGIESVTSFGGHPVFGARRPEWTALEDKIGVDALWDEAGVDRAPSEVVPAERAAAWDAHERLDQGEGTVWAGDQRDGWHGGGERVRAVRSAEDADRAVADLAPHCNHLRVMPFLDGLPCSVHGFVTQRGVAALRPVEMLVLRDRDGFRYCGTATTWDPAPSDRETMREVVRRVAARLRDRVGYRGFFTVDGVMTADGFRPTELNPRMGAGLRYTSAALPDLPLGLLQFAEVAGAVTVDVEALEGELLRAGDDVRQRACQTVVEGRRQTTDETHVVGDLSMVLGPRPMGAFLRVSATETPPAGSPFGPTAVSALDLADRRWDLGLGPLSAAVDRRCPAP